MNAILATNVPHNEPRERMFPASTKPPRVEGPCNLSIGLFGGQGADEFDDLRRSANWVRRAQRQRSFQRGRGPRFPADVDLDFLILHQGDVFNKQPQHTLAISRRSARIVPHAGKVGSQGRRQRDGRQGARPEQCRQRSRPSEGRFLMLLIILIIVLRFVLFARQAARCCKCPALRMEALHLCSKFLI